MSGWSVPGMVQVKETRADSVGRRVLARHRVTRRPVAITYLSPELLADTGFRTRFRDECVRLARVRETRMARVHRYVEFGSGAAVIGDHIRGTSLRTLLLAQGAVGTAAALVVLKDSLRALAAAHAAGLAHGDLKPESMILTSAGRVRLIDFGLWTSESRRMLAQSTPFYLAPEQWRESRSSHAGDVYAATTTFFECLAGAPPFYADEAAELSAKHAHSVAAIEVIPEPMRELVVRGLAKDPAGRPEAQQLLATISAAAAGALGPDWERQGRRELAELVANRSPLPVMAAPDRRRDGAGGGYGKPVRLAAVLGGALALAAGLSSPPLAVVPGINNVFGSGERLPVRAFLEPDQDTVAVRVTNVPLADRAPAPAAKSGTTAAHPPIPSVRTPSIRTAPYDHAAPDRLDHGITGSDGVLRTESTLGQRAYARQACTVADENRLCTARSLEQPPAGLTGPAWDPFPASVPLVLPVQLPVPVRVPKSIVIPDKVESGKDFPFPERLLVQLDKLGSPGPENTLWADRSDPAGQSTSWPQPGEGSVPGAVGSGHR
jgi:tRNA A-37 threonylcarbamoyl transferase component Bud32